MNSQHADQSTASLNERYVSQNARILKLIKSKMEPLQKSRSSKLFLPKIYRYFSNNNNSNDKEPKKYIEIQIKEEDENQVTPHTEIQEEHKYNFETQRTNYRLNSKKKTSNLLDSLLTLNHRKVSKRKQSLSSSQRFNCTLFEQNSYQLDQIGLKQKQYAKEQQNNMQRLNKIKQDIDDSKKKFLRNIKLSDYMGEKNDKENYNFEYIVNKIQTSKQREDRPTKHTTLSAYQDISPNKISDYIEILNPSGIKTAINDEQQYKDMVPIPTFEPRYRRHELKKKTTLIPHEPHSEMEHVASKLRLKANHKRLIQMNK